MIFESEFMQYLSIAKASQPPGGNDFSRNLEGTWNVGPFRFSYHSNASFCNICRQLRPPRPPGERLFCLRNIEKTWNVGPFGFS